MTDSVAHTVARLSQIPIPRDFKLMPQFNLPSHIPTDAYYYNIIVALATVALHDFDGVMAEDRFRTERFPQLPILINTPPPGRPIPTKYAVWGLVLAIVFLLNLTGFNTVFFSLQWQGIEVGGIGMGDALIISQFLEARSNGTDKTTKNLAMSNPPDSNITDSTTALKELFRGINPKVPSNEDNLSVDFDYYGQELQKEAVFMAIISALSEAAVKPAEDKVTGTFTSFFDDEHAQFTTRETTPARIRPPYYTYKWLIASLVRAVDHFVRNNVYRQLKMNLKLNNVAFAKSVLYYKFDPHLAPLETSTGLDVPSGLEGSTA